MADFHVTQKKITSLLDELRSWETKEDYRTLYQLAQQYELDKFVIDRVARSEGIHLRAGGYEFAPLDEPQDSDPNASTLDLDPEAIDEALSKPDPNPDYADRDADTGIWRKKPTGEWERIGSSDDED
jgi:hypothetical protein